MTAEDFADLVRARLVSRGKWVGRCPGAPRLPRSASHFEGIQGRCTCGMFGALLNHPDIGIAWAEPAGI